jgi:hypothetical protein
MFPTFKDFIQGSKERIGANIKMRVVHLFSEISFWELFISCGSRKI